jgi:hypothetical protein
MSNRKEMRGTFSEINLVGKCSGIEEKPLPSFMRTVRPCCNPFILKVEHQNAINYNVST